MSSAAGRVKTWTPSARAIYGYRSGEAGVTSPRNVQHLTLAKERAKVEGVRREMAKAGRDKGKEKVTEEVDKTTGNRSHVGSSRCG